MAGDLDPGFALFVGGFVAAMFFLGAGATYLLGPGDGILTGLSVALAGLGLVFLALGVLLAGILRLLEG